ncbi:uncharacterized protein LOC111882151 [Lactuca sativa]|uniref:Dynein light chain n=1 Tax=Lactuca sativa TaxID=4236 RepID=A0A9R1VYA9_LACSA|nr:uncharacterized protein LOC111882151 [Lactuca sativa]KAJ0213162.1 hypothetical protein LSAT_V11C400198780 [Lactuca sativa]
MSYNATHRRNLSAPTPKTAIDPTTANHHPPPSTTIQDISTHFSRLYLNHKARSFSKPSIHPQAEFTVSHRLAAASLTKSQSQRTRGNPHFINEEHQEESIKKAIVISSNEPRKNVNLLPGNQEKMRKLQQGYEIKMQSLPLVGFDRGKRRSFGCCSSKVELADFLIFNGVKVVSADMPPFMQIHAVDITRKTYDSLEKFTAKTLASTLKKEFDEIYGPAWHCIVGLSFGSFVTHSVGGFLYFSMDQKLYVLLFKTSVQRAH